VVVPGVAGCSFPVGAELGARVVVAEADGVAEGAGTDGAEGSGIGSAGPASRSWSADTRAPSSGVAVRSTGSIATEASTMLVSVAASQPTSGTRLRGDRTGP
jgi:hypothetical protein